MQYKESNIPQVISTDLEKLTEINLMTGDKKVLVGQYVPPDVEANLIEFLTDRLDAFAWELLFPNNRDDIEEGGGGLNIISKTYNEFFF